jgi:RHS repeat-associated protein
MQPALSACIPDGFMAAMRLGAEKPHQGVRSQNPAPNQVHEVCNFTVLLGLRGQAELNRVGSRSPGKERDAESGNDYFGARYYASSMGRFLSPDWSSAATPVPYASLLNPQTLNLYSYVQNNPLTGVDKDGHFSNGLLDPNWNPPRPQPFICMGDCMLFVLDRSAWGRKHPILNKILLALSPGSNCKNCQIGIVPFGFGGAGFSLGELAEDAGVVGAEAADDAIQTGAQTGIENVTNKGSVNNIKADISPDQFGKNLESNGFTKSAASDGTPTYTKGNTQYTVYSKATSTGGPTAQVKVDGNVVAKIRLN